VVHGHARGLRIGGELLRWLDGAVAAAQEHGGEGIPVHSPSWQEWRWRGIRGWVPVIGAAKDVLDRIICRIGAVQLFGPGRALGRIRTGTGAAVLGVARRLLVRGIA